MKMNIIFLFSLTTLFTLSTTQETINIAFFYPRASQELAGSASDIERVVSYGVDRVREDTSLLNGYDINITVYDSGCSQTNGNRAYIEMLQSSERNIFILGPACSPAANPIARDVFFQNIHIVSYSASSTELSDNATFRNFYRVIPSELVLVQARVNFVLQQGWKRVGIISNVDSLFSATATKINALLTNASINTELFLYVDGSSIPEIVKRIEEESYRILIGNFYAEDAVQFLCEFYKRGLVSPRITLLMLGWYPETYWNTTTTTCTPEQLRETLEYAVSFVSYPISLEPNAPTLLGPSSVQFRSVFNATVALEMFIFDSFATIVLALDRYANKYGDLCSQNSSFCLENFDYGSRGISELLNLELLETDFLGVSGRIQFDGVGDRIANATVSQWFNGVPQLTGLSFGEEIIYSYQEVTWPGGVIPSDGVEFQQDSIRLTQFVITSLLTIAAAILSVVYIILTLVYWKRKVIQAYQPTLTIAMLTGTLLLYACIMLYGLNNLTVEGTGFIVGEVGYDVICNLDLWLGFIGFGLTYVPIFLRTLEALYIVEYKTKRPMARNKFILKTYHLIIILAVYLGGIAVYLTIWTANSDVRLKLLRDERQVAINKIPTTISTPYCGSYSEIGRKITIGILMLLNCVLLILGMAFVILTKDLKYKGLNDSVYIGVSVYSLVIFGAFAYGASEILQLSVEIRFGMTAYSLIIGLVVVANLMVIPKLILVWRDKKDENEYGAIPLLKDRLSDNDFAVQLRTRVDTLEAENDNLKKQLRGSRKSTNKDSTKKETLTRKVGGDGMESKGLVPMEEMQTGTNGSS